MPCLTGAGPPTDQPVLLSFSPLGIRREGDPRGGLCRCWGVTIDQQLQMDGFNLYYRTFKDTPPRPGNTTRSDRLGLPFPTPGERSSGDSTDADSNPRSSTRLDKIKNLHSLDSIATETYGTHGRLTQTLG